MGGRTPEANSYANSCANFIGSVVSSCGTKIDCLWTRGVAAIMATVSCTPTPVLTIGILIIATEVIVIA